LKCLDTDFLVAVLRRQEAARRRVDQLDQEGRQSTTAVNAFELFYGASKSKMVEANVRESQRLLSRLEVLPLSVGSVEKAGMIFGGLELKGSQIEFRDAMIAGIAIDQNLTLVTRNKRDYSRVPGLTLEEW
jgi:predicted nucleic acid-binding protein